jgi:DNA invertase Pin-like site-specific DNA recombinase
MRLEADPFHLLMATSGSLAQEIVQSISDLGREIWGQRVKEGMARAKARGAKFGRPPKHLTVAELALVESLREKGYGWRRCASAIAKWRRVSEIADPIERRRATVSHTHLYRHFLSAGGVDKSGDQDVRHV